MNSMNPMILGAAVLFVFVIICVRCIRIVQQAKAYVIEFLGAYKTTWNVGIHFKLPFVERIKRPGMSAFTLSSPLLSASPRSSPSRSRWRTSRPSP